MSLAALVWAMEQAPGTPLRKLLLVTLSDGSADTDVRSFKVPALAAACQASEYDVVGALNDLAARRLITILSWDPGNIRLELPRDERPAPPPRSVESGFVYVLASSGMAKIGITQDVPKRLRAIQVGSPWPVDLVRSWEVTDHRKVERRAHERLAYARESGEWFRVPCQIAVEAVEDAIREVAQ